MIETGKYQLSEIVGSPAELRYMEKNMVRAGIRYGIAVIDGGYALLREGVEVERKVTDFKTERIVMVGDPYTGTEDIEIDSWFKPYKLHKVM